MQLHILPDIPPPQQAAIDIATTLMLVMYFVVRSAAHVEMQYV